MNAREALKELEQIDVVPGGIVENAKAALREKIAREESEKPQRPGLEEQEKATRGGRCDCKVQVYACCNANEAARNAAAETLKALRERVVPWLRWMADPKAMTPSNESSMTILRALGVEAK